MSTLVSVLAFGLLCVIVMLVFSSANRAERALNDDLRRLARRHGWHLPDNIDWSRLRIDTRVGAAELVLTSKRHGVAVRAPFASEHVQLQRRAKNRSLAAYPGLTPAYTGDEAFDLGCDVHTPNGSPPAWLGPYVRSGLLGLDEPVMIAADNSTLSVDLFSNVRSPFVLERLVEIAAAIVDPDVGRSRAAELARPVIVARPAAVRFFRLALFALAITFSLSLLVILLPPVHALYAPLLCEPGEVLDWYHERSGRSLTQLGCGGRQGTGQAGFIAWILTFELLALPALGGCFISAWARGRRYPEPGEGRIDRQA